VLAATPLGQIVRNPAARVEPVSVERVLELELVSGPFHPHLHRTVTLEAGSEAEDLDAAIELASRIPAARMGGAVEVRPIVER
jgi:hypothetical protein